MQRRIRRDRIGFLNRSHLYNPHGHFRGQGLECLCRVVGAVGTRCLFIHMSYAKQNTCVSKFSLLACGMLAGVRWVVWK